MSDEVDNQDPLRYKASKTNWNEKEVEGRFASQELDKDRGCLVSQTVRHPLEDEGSVAFWLHGIL